MPAMPAHELEHHRTEVRGTTLHHVSAGAGGTPVLLVHGFPETWRAFRGLLGLLAARHRVHAVDLRGFGDSAVAEETDGAPVAAADLHELIGMIGEGPVHLLAQDVSGGVGFRLAATHPDDVRSLTAVEAGLPGFGAEAFADVAHGGAWYIGALTAPGVRDLLMTGRERDLLVEHILPSYGVAVTTEDADELVRTYGRAGGLRGASALYRSLLADGEELRTLAAERPLTMPVLAVGSAGGEFTAATMRQVTAGPVESVVLDGVGHYVAQQAPERLAEVLLDFLSRVDEAGATTPSG